MVVTNDGKSADIISPSLAGAAMSFPPPPQFQGLMPPTGLKIPRFPMMMDDPLHHHHHNKMGVNPFGLSLPFTSLSSVPYLKPVSPISRSDEQSDDDKASCSDGGKYIYFFMYTISINFVLHCFSKFDIKEKIFNGIPDARIKD